MGVQACHADVQGGQALSEGPDLLEGDAELRPGSRRPHVAVVPGSPAKVEAQEDFPALEDLGP